ncbi:hypothetical protein HY450_02560 [Candidatus Pacearchaeota archaeon]|nr:hypothetical protein [Candidatus Pacearchaeota archaeon]
MAEKTILDQLRLDKAQKERLKGLEQKRMELEIEDQNRLDRYQETIEGVITGKQDTDVRQLSELDKGIERGQQFKGEISQLAESLTTELNELGQFFGDLNQYTGFWERTAAKVGLTRFADKQRLQRVRSSDVRENLQTILDYGLHMTNKLQEATLENMDCQAKIDSTIRITAKKLEETQPLYEKARSERERLERELKEIQDRQDLAEATEHAQLAVERETLERTCKEAQTQENYLFTIVDKAKQALPVQRVHLKAYGDIIDSLIQLKTGLEENIKNVTTIYESTPVAIQTALGTRAASQTDKGIKYATDKSTEVLLVSAKGILDENAARTERPLLESDKLRVYRTAQTEMRMKFDQRVEAMKKKYRAAATDE